VIISTYAVSAEVICYLSFSHAVRLQCRRMKRGATSQETSVYSVMTLHRSLVSATTLQKVIDNKKI
jgi:hypothetical protein